MRLEHDEKQARPYVCLICDHEFYWSENTEPSICPQCGAGEDALEAGENLANEEYSPSAN